MWTFVLGSDAARDLITKVTAALCGILRASNIRPRLGSLHRSIRWCTHLCLPPPQLQLIQHSYLVTEAKTSLEYLCCVHPISGYRGGGACSTISVHALSTTLLISSALAVGAGCLLCCRSRHCLTLDPSEHFDLVNRQAGVNHLQLGAPPCAIQHVITLCTVVVGTSRLVTNVFPSHLGVVCVCAGFSRDVFCLDSPPHAQWGACGRVTALAGLASSRRCDAAVSASPAFVPEFARRATDRQQKTVCFGNFFFSRNYKF